MLDSSSIDYCSSASCLILLAGNESNRKILKIMRKKDILKRSAWLKSKLLVSPKEIIGSMPKAIGAQFLSEWALYSCSSKYRKAIS